MPPPEAALAAAPTGPRRIVDSAMRAPGHLWLLARKSPQLLAHRRFPRSAERLLAPFASDGGLAAPAYEDLVRYFAVGWRTYRTSDGAGAAYPGLPSWSGPEVDALEGFSRIMPLFGAWCASGRETDLRLPDGEVLSLPRAFERGLVAGTDRSAPCYWGGMPGRSNQRIVEAADIALALWLFRDSVWADLPPQRRAAIVDWLSQVGGAPGLDNNWHLFFVIVDRVLAALGHSGLVRDARRHFERVKAFHLGDGWFEDGPRGRVDFYSAWGFHYALNWIDRIDPEWDPDFIRASERPFLESYKHVIGPQGLPMLGRSVCYRMAAPAPLAMGCDRHPDVVSAGEARRALDCVWRHFIRRGAARHGAITQGYYGPDPRILDPYSGPASSLWSLRSLIAAIRHPRGSEFWQSTAAPLPVERDDFDFTTAGGRWRVHGERETGAVGIEVLDNPPAAAPMLVPLSRRQVLRRFVRGQSLGPRNDEAKYGRRHYSSDRPFCV